jgi:hypothetical protein
MAMADPTTSLEQVLASSSQLTTWALAAGGAAVAMIAGTAYHRPRSVAARLPFLLFLPGWFFIGRSLLAGSDLSGAFLASRMVAAKTVQLIGSRINDLYADQSRFLLWGIFCFAAWLSLYVVIWVFTDQILVGKPDE